MWFIGLPAALLATMKPCVVRCVRCAKVAPRLVLRKLRDLPSAVVTKISDELGLMIADLTTGPAGPIARKRTLENFKHSREVREYLKKRLEDDEAA